MVVLKNNILTVEIDLIGAEIRRVLKGNEDCMWSGNPEYWSGVSPLLFPICSGLPEDKYTYNGKTYDMPKHGFVKKALFEAETVAEDTATFLFKSNEETLKCFPWEFELRVRYSLNGSQIKVEYIVLNKSNDTMYYSIGSHESYSCPEGIEKYDVVFEKEEALKTYLLDGTVLSGETETVLDGGNVLALDEKYFSVDALIFKNVKSRAASLVNRETGKTATVCFPGAEYLLLWHPVGAPFMCIEPWEGICATKGDSIDITEKEGIMSLESGKEKVHTHTVEYK